MYISQKSTHLKLKCLQYIVGEVTWHGRWTPFPRGRNFIELLQTFFVHVILCAPQHFFFKYRWVPLKPDFLGAWKSVWLKHYPAYPIIIISLIIQRNLATKIWAKQESGLTTVRLKWDPPVVNFPAIENYMNFTFVSDVYTHLQL